MTSVKIQNEYISASCNCTYNCLELGDGFLVYGANHALAVHDLQECKTVHTLVAHDGRINCVRFVKSSLDRPRSIVSSCSKGTIIIWEQIESSIPPKYKPRCSKKHGNVSITVCDGIQTSEDQFLIGCLTTDSRVLIYEIKDCEFILVQEMNFKKSLALDLVFHNFPSSGNQRLQDTVLALGMDSGSVNLYSVKQDTNSFSSDYFLLTCCLSKHEDWVRCITFVTLENGDVLLATGGQDSFIAVWRLTKSNSTKSAFEFQVHNFKDYLVIFDSMIIGHEGWINSLDWNSQGDLISCSSDQSIIIWTYTDDLWTEKSRFGVLGGQIPGGYGAKFLPDFVVSYGFQGAIQIWKREDGDEWTVQPSITGHFAPVSDMDYDIKGNYIVTTSLDQTTRIHAPWGLGRWHEISRPQIHGHDLFSVRPIGNLIVSGAEEKILRAFEPPDIFFRNLEDVSEIVVDQKSDTKAASIPALGLSNQSEDKPLYENVLELPLDVRLDEDFLRSQTLWPEVSKLYGHVYEISCIGTSPVDALVASGSQSSKTQFSAIILWCATRWKNLGEFQFHKLNVTGLEFSPDGKRLLSVSRDRTWAVWTIKKDCSGDHPTFSMEVLQSDSFHTRALWVGTWSPCGKYFVTGARDKKLAVWKNNEENNQYCLRATKTFSHSVSSAAINEDNIIVVGLETGTVDVMQFDNDQPEDSERLSIHMTLDKSTAHHDVIKRLRFNPKEKNQFASVSADHITKVYEIIQS